MDVFSRKGQTVLMKRGFLVSASTIPFIRSCIANQDSKQERDLRFKHEGVGELVRRFLKE